MIKGSNKIRALNHSTTGGSHKRDKPVGGRNEVSALNHSATGTAINLLGAVMKSVILPFGHWGSHKPVGAIVKSTLLTTWPQGQP